MPRCDTNPTSQTKRARRFAERGKSAERNSRPSAWRSRVARRDKPAHRRSNRHSNPAFRAVTKATLTMGVGMGLAAPKLQASEAEAAQVTSAAKPGVNDVKPARTMATVKVSVSEARAAGATSTAKPGDNGVKLPRATATRKVSVSGAKAAKLPATVKVSVN